jgi:hypothetical protein
MSDWADDDDSDLHQIDEMVDGLGRKWVKIIDVKGATAWRQEPQNPDGQADVSEAAAIQRYEVRRGSRHFRWILARLAHGLVIVLMVGGLVWLGFLTYMASTK